MFSIFSSKSNIYTQGPAFMISFSAQVAVVLGATTLSRCYDSANIKQAQAERMCQEGSWLWRLMFANKTAAAEIGTPFPVVGPSPYPIALSFALLCTGGHIICSLRQFSRLPFHWLWPVVVVSILLGWLWEVYREENQGLHTLELQENFKSGIYLFILSEFMLFSSFFWGFFHLSLNPSIWIGASYPPLGIIQFDWWRIPLLNTVILLSSGISLTIAHKLVSVSDRLARKEFFEGLYFSLFSAKRTLVGRVSKGPQFSTKRVDHSIWVFDTVLRGFTFLGFQAYEYITSLFTISDSVYGSVFFSLTGLHGLHVFIGALMLAMVSFTAWSQLVKPGTSQLAEKGFLHNWWKHRVAFDGAAWYWHFVDIIWLFVFLIVYWWGWAI